MRVVKALGGVALALAACGGDGGATRPGGVASLDVTGRDPRGHTIAGVTGVFGADLRAMLRELVDGSRRRERSAL